MRASLLLGLLRRRSEISADDFVELLFADRDIVVVSDLLNLLRSRLLSKHDRDIGCELVGKGATELLDSLLEGRAIQSTKSTSACKGAAGK